MTKARDTDIPVEFLHECFDYDPEIGVLTWRTRPRKHFRTELSWRQWNAQRAGRQISGSSSQDYPGVTITLEGRVRRLKVHRVAWAMSTGRWPPEEIDHLNRNKRDRRLANLREATKIENMANRVDGKHYKKGERPRGMGQMTFRVPENEFNILAQYAAQMGQSKSAVVKELIWSLAAEPDDFIKRVLPGFDHFGTA